MVDRETLAEGKHLGLYVENSWEFAARPHVSAVVGILPGLDKGGDAASRHLPVGRERGVQEKCSRVNTMLSG